jgi:thiamine-phosphate pyrophosphorylase
VDAGLEAGDEATMDDPVMTEDGARLWAAAQALARAADSVSGPVHVRVPPMLLFTDPDRTPRPWEIAARMPAGSGVIYRSFGAPDALATAERLRAVTLARGMALLIGLDADLAERVGADGLHLPERALTSAYSLSGRRPGWVLTGAVHSVEAAKAARDLDAVVLSPILPAGGASATKPALGLGTLAEAAAGSTRVIALGGIRAGTAAKLKGSGAYGLAAIGGIAEAFGA